MSRRTTLSGLALASLAFAASALWALDPVNTDRQGVALEGYDTVAYFHDGKPVRGNEAISAKWNGATWYFTSEEHRKMFEAEPAKYAPQYGGYCAKAVSDDTTADADPLAWRIVEGKLYLNYSPKIHALWEQDIPGRIARADANWPKLVARD